MNQILEVLKALKSFREDTLPKNEEVISSHPLFTHLGTLQTQNNNIQGVPIPFPQYDIPLGYTSAFEEYLKQDQILLNQNSVQMPTNIHVIDGNGTRNPSGSHTVTHQRVACNGGRGTPSKGHTSSYYRRSEEQVQNY